MKSILLLQFLLLASILSGQSFTEALGIPFDSIASSHVTFVDVDGDNDQDILLPPNKVYINNGVGNFTEAPGIPLLALFSPFHNHIAFAVADVDGDNDQDVFISGFNYLDLTQISKLYLNDGMGNFTEAVGAPFEGFAQCDAAFADVDGDNDQDLLITGWTDTVITSKLYINDGIGNFTDALGTPIDGVAGGSIAFADVDGDNDPDVLITGYTGTGTISKLYINDGMGNFTEALGTNFDALPNGAIAFADVDGDSDLDVLITGKFGTGTIAKLYINDGMGNFTLKASFGGKSEGDLAFADVDGDGDLDFLMSGYSSTGHASAVGLYINDGGGNFTYGTQFLQVGPSSIAVADVDGDNDQDVLISGVFFELGVYATVTKLYINQSPVSSIDGLFRISNLDFEVSPNPINNGRLSVWYDSREFGRITLQVFDLTGGLLMQQEESSTVGQKNFSVDISSLEKGTYVIELDNGKRKGVVKFIVQ